MTEPLERLKAALVDRYRIERELGAGGMATVYAARDLRHDREVAIKVLRPELAATLGPQRFLQEIQIAARLTHPHILPLHDSGQADGFLYYVMPYVEGESLRDRLSREGELPVVEAVRILKEVTDALAYAHGQGVVHRDIKPENVMLSGRHALVTDFGVAKALHEATGRQQLTTAGVALGTPAYMAPEQAAADPHMDHRVDLYAVGAMGYELLAGRPPFTGASPQMVLAAQVTEVPRPVTEHRPAVPPALAGTIMRCLEKRPADRWQTAEELLTQLEVLASTPSGGMTPTGMQPVTVAARPVAGGRRRLGLGLAVVLAGATVALWRILGGPSAPEVTLGQTVPVTSDFGLEIDPALSADGSLIAFAAGPMMGTRIYVRQVDGGRPILLDSTGAGQRWPRWSPDGKRIAFVEGTTLRTVPALGGHTRQVAGGAAFAGGADWSPDGRSLAYTARDSLYVVEVDGGTPKAIAAVWEGHSPAWSPDGRFIAVVEGNSAYVEARSFGNIALSTIFTVPFGGGTRQLVTSQGSSGLSPAWLPNGKGLVFISDRDGTRDLFLRPLDENGGPVGEELRITTGLKPHSVTIAASGGRLAYSLYTTTSNIWSLPIPSAGTITASAATPVTRGNQYIETMDASPDGRWVYFESDRSGRSEIYRIPAEGGEPVQLTNAPGLNFYPDASPDGQEVVFQSQRNGNRDLFLMPAAGGPATPLVTVLGVDNQPLWFPDGRSIAFLHSGGDLPDGWYAIDRTDGGWGTPRLMASSGTIVPGRQFHLLQYPDSLLALSVDGTTRRRLWARPDTAAPLIGLRPRPSPDGTKIWFMDLPRVGSPRASIWELPAGGGAPHPVVRFEDLYQQPLRNAAWDTDGRRFYVILFDRQSDIWTADFRLQ